MTDLADLRAKAEAATPGPWRWKHWAAGDAAVLADDTPPEPAIVARSYGLPNADADAAYIAAANPQMIRQLLDLLRDWAQWIVREDDERHHADNACAECVPNGPILIDGFRCDPHQARAFLGLGSFTALAERQAPR